MPGLGGSSRDDAKQYILPMWVNKLAKAARGDDRPFIYPSMKGMPKREKDMRAAAELGKAKAAQKKSLNYAKQSRAAYQSGAYALGAKRAAQAKDRKLQEATHKYRYSRYKINR